MTQPAEDTQPGERLLASVARKTEAATVDALLDRVAQALHDRHCLCVTATPVGECRSGDPFIETARDVLPELAGWLRAVGEDPTPPKTAADPYSPRPFGALPAGVRHVARHIARTIEKGAGK